jgi:hypothetical protein
MAFQKLTGFSKHRFEPNVRIPNKWNSPLFVKEHCAEKNDARARFYEFGVLLSSDNEFHVKLCSDIPLCTHTGQNTVLFSALFVNN